MSDEESLFEAPDEAFEDGEEDSEEAAEEELIASHFPNEEVMAATNLYLREIAFAALITAAEEVHYARLVQKGDQDARRHMIAANLCRVVKIARRYANR